MIDKICVFLTNKIRKEDPSIDDERAEVINYGLQIIVGEIPKTIIMLAVAYLLGVFKLSLLTFLVLIPYRGASGGFHLHTHIGCIISTCIMYSGVALLSKFILLTELAKYFLIGSVWLFGMIMINYYAPADTEDVPILESKVRKKKQIASYFALTAGLASALFINDSTISNILIFGNLVQTLTITKLAYRLTNNKYGYEVYGEA
ncbi:MAG: accessory gene regulator B family protein [Clostridia bacterium]|nr:accessory gene regulator B family protein [Clostridia bacterium]